MFSIPKYGWTKIDIEGYTDTASYIDSVVKQVFKKCHAYLHDKIGQFQLAFDAEGHSFGVVLINDELFYWTDKLQRGTTIFPIFEGVSAEEGIKTIAQEMLTSFENNKEDWVRFEAVYEEDETSIRSDLEELYELVKQDLELPTQNMELGNLLFGHSRGEFQVDRKWQDCFVQFLDRCGFDRYGHIDNEELEKHLKTVEGTAYVRANGETFPEHAHYFDNGTFCVRPYFWGESENIQQMPNFIFYKTGYQIQWYKYPLRDSYCNKEISFDEFKRMLQECEESLKGDDEK